MLKKVLGYKKDIDQKCFWHERSALQSVGVRRSTGNDVSGQLFSPLFSIFFFSIFSLSRPFLIEGVFGSKKLVSEVDRSTQ